MPSFRVLGRLSATAGWLVRMARPVGLAASLSLMPASLTAQAASEPCCDRIQPPFQDAAVTALELSDGELFMVPSALGDVAGFGALIGGETLSAKLSQPQIRAKVYTQALLSAIAADELARLEPEAAHGVGGSDALASLAGGLSNASDAAGIADDVTAGIRAIEAADAARRAGARLDLSADSAATRLKSTVLGRSAAGLSILSLAANLASDFDAASDRVNFLSEAIRDARVAGALADLEAVLRAMPGHDPAMLEGVADARTRLTRLSESRLRRLAAAGGAAFRDNLGTMAAGMALARVASGGAAMVAREVVQLGLSLNDFTARTVSISAMHNLVAGSLAQLRMLADDDASMLEGLSRKDIDVTRLAAFEARLSAEATAATYNLLWTDRWDAPLSFAGLGKALGMTASEVVGAADDLKPRYRDLVARRAQLQRDLWAAAAAGRAPAAGDPERTDLVLKADFDEAESWKALTSKTADRRTQLGRDPETGTYVTETYDARRPWYAIGLSPAFAPIGPDESFRLSFTARPEALSWGEYPSLRLWSGAYEDDRGLPNPPALVINVSWSDNVFRKWRLVAVTPADRNPRDVSKTIPKPYGAYRFDVQYDARRQLLSWTIHTGKGALFHSGEIEDVVFETGFRHVFVGEVQGSTKYGSGARVQWDDIVVRRGRAALD